MKTRTYLFGGIWTLLAIAVVVALSISPGVAQDQTEQRIAGLEARVSALETQVAGLTSTGISDESNEEYVVSGFLRVTNPFKSSNPPLRDKATFDASEQTCANSGELREFRTGAKVIATNQNGATIATSTLELRPGYVPEGGDSASCEYVFLIELPRFEFVTFEIGGIESPTYSFEELEASSWEVKLSI